MDPGALALVEPRLAGGEQAFAPFAQAVAVRQTVTFHHRRSGATVATARRLQPWGVVSRRGRWYVVGHDLDRDAPRAFRLDRVVGAVLPVGQPGAFTLPDDVDIAELVADPSAGRSPQQAVLRVRIGAGHGLRRRATSVVSAGEGWERITLTTRDEDRLVREVLAHGSDVVVEEPQPTRDLVVAALTALAGES